MHEEKEQLAANEIRQEKKKVKELTGTVAAFNKVFASKMLDNKDDEDEDKLN